MKGGGFVVGDYLYSVPIAILGAITYAKSLDVFVAPYESCWKTCKNLLSDGKCEEACEGRNNSIKLTRFIVSIVVGVLIILVSTIVPMPPSIARGLILLGSYCFLQGNWEYWDEMSDKTKLLVSIAGLIALIVSVVASSR